MKTDKLLHILCCYAIANSVADYTNAWLGFLASISVAALKEVWDHFSGKGTPEVDDFLAGFVGAVVGAIVELFSHVV